MPLALTVTDNAGTPSIGAVATVGGSAGGTVTVYAQPVTGQTGSGTWTSYGSRTGDGTVSLALAAGYWWVYAIEGADLSGLAYTQVTTGLTAVETRCKAAIAATITLLNLPIRAIHTQFDADDKTNLNNLCVVLDTGDGVRETDEAAMNNRDDLGHPVRVCIFDTKDQFDQSATKQALYESMRQSIWRAFHNQRLAGVPESVINKVEPLALTEMEKGRYQWFRSGLLIRCRTRELRGLGA
jgi:hypothetical protein